MVCFGNRCIGTLIQRLIWRDGMRRCRSQCANWFLGDGNILFLCIKHRYTDRFHREGRQLGRKMSKRYPDVIHLTTPVRLGLFVHLVDGETDSHIE